MPFMLPVAETISAPMVMVFPILMKGIISATLEPVFILNPRAAPSLPEIILDWEQTEPHQKPWDMQALLSGKQPPTALVLQHLTVLKEIISATVVNMVSGWMEM